MSLQKPCLPYRSRTLSLAAAAVLFSGLLYYLFWRVLAIPLRDFTQGSYPSLVHIVTLTWLAFAFTGPARGLSISLTLLALSLIAEHHIGYFYALDATMLVTGFALATITAHCYLLPVRSDKFVTGTAIAATLLTTTSAVFILGSGFDCHYCGAENSGNAKPEYLSYQDLRSGSVVVTDARPLSDVSRVYVYNTTLFLNNKNKGIHVIDNSVPADPKNIGFIEIPGNTELSIRSNYLYADSYVDLVTIDIAEPRNVQVVDRSIDIFPYDPYQNIPDENISFGYDGVDKSRGVVVSYERIN